jgi:HK97 family phage major capsid protein
MTADAVIDSEKDNRPGPLIAAEEKFSALAEEIRTLADKGELTSQEEARFESATIEFTHVQDERDNLRAKYDRLVRASKLLANRTPGDSRPAPSDDFGSRGMSGTARITRDPYDLSEIRSLELQSGPHAVGTELRARAHDAIEQAPEFVTDEHRKSAARLVDAPGSGRDEGGPTIEYGPSFSDYMLRHGSPEYTRAWFQYIHGGIDRVENRAALSTTGANGGFMIPFFLDPTIILTNAGTVNPFRAIAKVVTIPTNVWHGVSSAGVTAEWTGEATEVTDASPTFVQPTITPVRADAYVQASFEVVADSNVAAQIGMLFADAKDRLEGTAFATGTGSTQPEGIVTRLNVTTASKVAAQTNASFGAVDVFALVNNLPARYQDNCSWLGHWFVYNLARQFGGANQPNFWVDLGPGIPSQMLGRSVYQSSAMLNAGGAVGLSSATASNDNILILGDFAQGFLIVDRIGMEVVYNPLVIGSNRRPTGEVGWAAFWRVGSDTTNAAAFVMLQV